MVVSDLLQNGSREKKKSKFIVVRYIKMIGCKVNHNPLFSHFKGHTVKRSTKLALLVIILSSVACGSSLQGVVRDAQSLLPLDTVDVVVHVLNPDSIAFPTRTDQDGQYLITGIIPDNKIYVVMTYRIGYVWSYTRIDNLASIGSLDTLVFDIYLTPDGTLPHAGQDTSTVFGTVLTWAAQSNSFVPVADAQVGLTSGGLHLHVATDAQGKYTTKIPVGYYSISVNATGYENLTMNGIAVESTGKSVNAVLKSSPTGVITYGQSKPGKFGLLDAYPCPFNPATTIRFILPERGRAILKVHDILGREVAVLADGDFDGGVEHRVMFDASNLSSGVYFSRLEFGNQFAVKKLVVLK